MVKPTTPDPPATLWHRSDLHRLRISRPWPSLQPVCCLFVTQVLFSGFFAAVPILFLKGKVPPGCNLVPKPRLVPSHCECLTRFYCSKINTPISTELKSHTSHYGRWFCPASQLLFFFFCSFSVTFLPMSQGEPSVWHLISWIFVLLFLGGCGSTYAEVHWGNSKRGR